MESTVTPTQQSHQQGRASRKRIPRSQHAHWKRTGAARSAYRILQANQKGRLPHLVSLKYQRMAASPFGYYRGAVSVMAYDIARGPSTGILCQLCGDAHVLNLGSYAAPDGRMVFDINDFDESIPGPFEWDIKRMAASIHLATREAKQSERDCAEAVHVFIHRYIRSIKTFAAMPIVDIARYQIHRACELETMHKVFLRAQRTTPLDLRDALTRKIDPRIEGRPGENSAPPGKHEPSSRVFRSNPPVLERLTPATAAPVIAALGPYLRTLQPERRHLLSRYRPVDAAFKVVGTGSVGLRDYVLYFEGNGPCDPLFLQIKQEVESAWAPYLEKPAKSRKGDGAQGRRVVDGQRAMQIQSDPFLGYTHIDGFDYIVRQLNDRKGSVNLETLDLPSILHYADLCGEILARGHARSGDPQALEGYIGGGAPFRKAISAFASTYADQTEKDWKELKKHLATHP